MANVKLKPNYKRIEGILLPGMFKPESIKEVMNYGPNTSDVFIETYPKCGSTWMTNIVAYIFRKGEELEDPMLLRRICPFIDSMGIKGIENILRPGAFKTHLPFSHVPYSENAKYIYVIRNPKDCCVSMYYHTKRGQPMDGYGAAVFSDFFELFMEGEVEYDDYFDHLMSWYPHRNDKNVFFTTYEDMKKDTKDIVLKLASFLGKEYIDAIEKDNNVLNNILRLSGFDYMKTNLKEVYQVPPKPHMKEDSKLTKERDDGGISAKVEKIDFIRKGIVGDWKNHFSEEQNERMNKKFTERTQGTEIYDMYKSYMFD